MWQVNRFRDSATDKRLCGAHHADMAMRMNIAQAFPSAFVGTVKNGQMFFLKEGGAFEHHSTAYIIICSFYLFVGKSECFQQAPFKVIVLLRGKTKPL